MLKKLLKKIGSPLVYLFIERYTFLSLKKAPSFPSMMFNKIKFGLAGKGIKVTDNEKKLKSFENKYRGKRCFIIGNGPSLNELDLSKLKNEYTFGVNAIYLNYERMGFYPTFYVVEDYLVAEDRASEINSYSKSEAKFFGTYLKYVLKNDPKTINLNVLITHYMDKNYSPLFSKNLNRKVGVGGSVTFICLQLAYFMGFDEVVMIGFDHHYDIPKTAIVGKDSGVIESGADDVNHFNKEYFGKGYRWHQPKVERMEMGFKAAKIAFESDGRKVINATKGGHLEVFERQDYTTLFPTIERSLNPS